jgi:hypothetical protein
MESIQISEALRMFRRSRKVKKQGFKRYKGTPEQIAKQIIEDCWNKKKKYFMVSNGHFCEFYTRDFGMCAEALVKLGHRKRVIQTLEYALKHFEKHGSITTIISPDGRCFDFPKYAVDSLPFLVHAIAAAKAPELAQKYWWLLRDECRKFTNKVIDNKLCMVKQHAHFSSMKDYSKRCSATYDNCMVHMLHEDLDSLGHERLAEELGGFRISGAILHNLWNGRYFHEDMSKQKIVTGDANTFPFWCKVTKDKETFRKCITAMEKAGLTEPFPLKYAPDKTKTTKAIWREIIAGDYERDTIWLHLGLCFLDVVKQYDKKRFKKYMKQYENLIKKHRNFLEVYDRDGKPFKTPFYITDESMLWVSKWLALKKN